MLKGGVRLAAVAVDLEEEVVGDDGRDHAGLGDEAVQREHVGVAALADEGRENGVAGEDRGAAIRVDGMTDEERGLLEVILPDQFEDIVVELEPLAGERRRRLGELGSIGISRSRVPRVRNPLGRWRRLRVADRGDGRLDAQAALAATALGRSLLRCGEGE